jgi:hypothetical protein
MLRAVRCSAVAPLFFPLALVTLLFGGSPGVGQAQTNWDRYTPGTIAAIMQQHDSSIRADYDPKYPTFVISGDDFPTLARVAYRGDSRPLNPKNRDVMRRWSLSFLRDTSVVLDFHREYLFKEGRRLLWLPVQDSVAGYFARELHRGQPVTLYIIWAGAYYAGEGITWTFLVNEFRADSSSR